MTYLEVSQAGSVVRRCPLPSSRAEGGCVVRTEEGEAVVVLPGQAVQNRELQYRIVDDRPTTTSEAPPPPDGDAVTFSDAGEVILPLAGVDQVPHIDGYRIIDKIGEGGMGVVWRAVQLSTRQLVALKMLNYAGRYRAKSRARFEREIELSARLLHPNIARVYDSGLHRDMPFFVMELVDGVPLDQYVQDHGLTAPQNLRLIKKICEAVDHAHRRGIIHRDLKPSNVLVTADGEPHVLDFGLAKAIAEGEDMQITEEGVAAGTLAYMPPEQAAGRIDQVDTRADIYALGAILFRMLTGDYPHDMSGVQHERRRRVIEDDARRPRSLAGDIDYELEAIVVKCLARDPNGRYGSAAELATEIERYLTGEPLIARRLTAVYFLRKKLRKHWVRAVTVAAFLGVLTGVAAYSVNTIREERDIAEQAAEDRRQALYLHKIPLSHMHIQNNRVDQAIILLDQCPEDLRNWEWYYLRGLADQSTWTMRPQDHGIGSLERMNLSADGKRVVALEESGVINRRMKDRFPWSGKAHAWETETGKPIPMHCPIDLTKAPLAIGLDGESLAVMFDSRSVQFWDYASDQVETVTLGREPVDDAGDEVGQHIGLSSDRKAFATCSGKGLLIVWDRQTGQPLREFRKLRLDSTTPQFTLDRRFIYAKHTTGPLMDHWGIWNIESGQSLNPVKAEVVDISPDSSRIAVGAADGSVRVIDLNTGSTLWSAEGHGERVTSIHYDPGGARVITFGGDRQIKTWDAENGTALSSQRGHHFPPRTARLASSGKLAVSMDQVGTIKGWRLDTAHSRVQTFARGERDYVLSIRLSSNEQELLVHSLDHGLSVLNLKDGSWRPIGNSDGAEVTCVDLSSDGGIAVGTAQEDGTVEIWDISSGKQKDRLVTGGGQVQQVAFHPTKPWLAVQGVRSLMVWHVESQKRLAVLEGAGQVAFDPEGRFLVSAVKADSVESAYDLVAWAIDDNWAEHSRYRGHREALHNLAFCPNSNRFASSDSAGEVIVWSLSNPTAQYRLRPFGRSRTAGLSFSPDGTRLLTCGPSVKLWDVSSGNELVSFGTELFSSRTYQCTSFTKSARTIISGTNRGIVEWSNRRE